MGESGINKINEMHIVCLTCRMGPVADQAGLNSTRLNQYTCVD